MQNFPQYKTKQKIIHWVTALFTFIVILLPLAKVTMSPYVGGMANLFLWHKSLGVMIFLLTLWRIYIITKEGVPDVLPKNEKLQRILSKSVQGFIYILLIVAPLSGYLMSSRPLNVFGLIFIPPIAMPNDLYGLFHFVHIWGSYALICLLILHVVGSFYHYFWLKDKVLQSMLSNR